MWVVVVVVVGGVGVGVVAGSMVYVVAVGIGYVGDVYGGCAVVVDCILGRCWV
jgi:hypothetical protein